MSVVFLTRVLLVEFAGGALRAALLVAMVAIATGTGWTQCQMCKETASYQKASAIEALNRGIILLAIPPAAIIGGIAWLTYHHRNGYRPED